MGAYDQALPLYQRALQIREKALGPEHPDTATSLNNLALLYEDLGAYEQALPLFQRAPADLGKGPGARSTPKPCAASPIWGVSTWPGKTIRPPRPISAGVNPKLVWSISSWPRDNRRKP